MKKLALAVTCLLLVGSISNAVIIMDATTHNGALTASAYGWWHSTPAAVPAGWTLTANYIWQTALQWAQVGSTGEAVNNTGELVLPGYAYQVSAALGGGDGVHARVRVYATQNADGTGDKVLLASVLRNGLPNDGYNLFNTVGELGAPAPSSLAGYYIQVKIGGPWSDYQEYIGGNYDNIVVTAEFIPEPATMTILALGGLLLRKRK